MTQEILNILLSALGVVITGLASFAVAKFTQWINAKIADNKMANSLSTVAQIVMNCVQEMYQTYVETLKKSDNFNQEAQQKALEKCLAKVKSQLSSELVGYINTNFGNIDSFLVSLIESSIYSLKNKEGSQNERV